MTVQDYISSVVLWFCMLAGGRMTGELAKSVCRKPTSAAFVWFGNKHNHGACTTHWALLSGSSSFRIPPPSIPPSTLLLRGRPINQLH